MTTEMTADKARSAFASTVQGTALNFLKTYHPEKARDAAGRLALAVRQAASVNSDIYNCDAASVARAIGMCVVTGLSPGGALPLVWLIPRKVKDRATNQYSMTLNWQISVRGLEMLAHRAGYRVRSVPVFAQDDFTITQGLRPDIQHEPDEDAVQSWGDLRGVYVVSYCLESPQEPYAFEWVPKSVLERLRAAGGTNQGGPWNSWPIEMARARAVGYALRRGVVPLSEGALAEAAANEGGPVDGVEARVTDEPMQDEAPRTLRSVVLTAPAEEIDVTPDAADEPAMAPAPKPAVAVAKPDQAPAPAEDDQARAILHRAGVTGRRIDGAIGKARDMVLTGKAPSFLQAVDMIVGDMAPAEDMP